MTVRAVAQPPGAAPGPVPRATSWLLLALTALAAFVGTGLETGSRGAGPLSTSGTAGSYAREPGSGPRGERLSQLPAPSVLVGAAAPSQAGSGPAPDLLPAGPQAPAPHAAAAHGHAAVPTYAAWLLDGGSARAPPVTTGT